MTQPPSPDRTAAERIFHDALDQPENAQAAFVRRACAGDEALRAEVESLLEADRRADNSPTLAAALATPTGTPPTPAEQPGAQIGRYRLLQLLGEGGFGTVWMAEQREPVKRRVALKVIKLGMDTRQVIARFEAERQALAMMDHPNIAKVLDAGATDTGRPYFVMEYIRGVPIVEYCDTERLDTSARLTLFASVCNSIQHAHQKGLIHRDIKPGNVLVTLHDGVPVAKVIDFGIAKATGVELTQRTLFTEHRQFIGTPAYMSPEQAEMSGLDIDTRSDIYSLGVLLYELLTGTTPFRTDELLASGLAEMMRIIREVEPPRPSTRLSTLGETADRAAAQRRTDVRRLGTLLRGDLDWIVMKCLEKDRTRRYDTASALAADLLRHLNHEPVLAGPPGAAYRAAKFVRRHRAQVLAAAAIGVALVLGVIGTSVGFVRAAAEAGLRTQQRDTAAGALARVAQEVRRRAESDGPLPAGHVPVAAPASQEPVQELADTTVRLLDRLDELRLAETTQRTAAQRAAEDARRNQQRAEQIAGLLREIMQSADPARDGAQVPLVEVLRRADRLFAGRFDDQPLVELDLRETLGRTFLQLASPRDATPHLERAMDLASRHAPPDLGPDSTESKYQWFERWIQPVFKAAVATGDAARGPRAITTVADGLATERGPDDPMVRLLRDAARSLEPAVKSATSPAPPPHAAPAPRAGPGAPAASGRAARLRERVDECRREHGDDHVRTIDAMYELAAALRRPDEQAEADQWYQRAAELEARVRPAEDPARRRHAIERAVAEAARLPADGAIAQLNRAIADDERLAGPGQPEVIEALQAIASHRQRAGDTEGRAAALRQALQIAESRLGGAHPTTITASLEVMPDMLLIGQADEAEELIVRRLQDVERGAGQASPFFGILKGAHGHVLAARGRHAEAVTVLREAIAQYGKTAALPESQAWDPRSRLISSLIELSRWDEAEAELQWFVRDRPASDPFAPILRRQGSRLYTQYYERRHAADPSQGFEAKAAEWREKAKMDARPKRTP